MAIKIMIDPGHYEGWNKVACGYAEGTQMWKLSQYLIPLLYGYGFEVGCTKKSINDYPKDSNGDDYITERGRMAAGYDIMLSLHTNACNTESVNRPVVIYPINGDCKQLAASIGANLQQHLNLQTYQIYYKYNSAGNANYYGVIRGAAQVGVPCLIIEHTFHTNNAMAKYLLDDSHLEALAKCVADTVANYYGYSTTTDLTTSTSISSTSSSTGTIYRIRKSWADVSSQIGAYRVLDNAKRVCPDGYYVYDEAGNAVYTPTSAVDVPASAGNDTSTTVLTWTNGSTSEPVYADTSKKTQIGSMNPYESCECLGVVKNMYIVKYRVDGTGDWKVGFVSYRGGI